MKRQHITAAAFYSLLIISSLVFLGCEIGSSDSVARDLDFNVTGIYRNTDTNANNGKLVSDNSGSPITQLDLRQTGDQLEANDNNGKIFSGTIGDEGNYTMTGQTTAGKDGTMTGTIEASGGVGTMRGTWIEDGLYGTIYGQATVASNSSGGGGSCNVSIDPASRSLAQGASGTFAAQNGTASYSWEIVSGSGGYISGSGSSITFVQTNGSAQTTIRVTDGNSCTATASIN